MSASAGARARRRRHAAIARCRCGLRPSMWLGRRHGIEMVSMRQSDYAPLLRFLMLVIAGSAEGRCFVLRSPAKGKSNAG